MFHPYTTNRIFLNHRTVYLSWTRLIQKKLSLLNPFDYRFKEIDHPIESFIPTDLVYQRGENEENHFMSNNPIVIKKVCEQNITLQIFINR